MNTRAPHRLVLCAVLGASLVGELHAQTAPAAPAAGRQGAAPGGAAGGRRGGGGGARGPQTPPGPPAPVPPEVAIARPTTDELARMNAELQRFITTSPSKDLFQKYAGSLSIPAPRDNPCIRPTAGNAGRHQSFVNIATTGDYDVMFLGDSITDLLNVNDDGGGNPGGKAVMEKYFSDVKVANFGISGDTTQGVLWRLQNGEGQGRKPKAVMVMIGTNNLNAQTSGAEVAEGIGAITLELRKDFPDAKIMLVAIFPRDPSPADPNRKKIEEANRIVARLDDKKHVFFVNLNEKFLNPQGGLVGFRTSDSLHPVEQGFDIWISSVAPTLKDWIK